MLGEKEEDDNSQDRIMFGKIPKQALGEICLVYIFRNYVHNFKGLTGTFFLSIYTSS